MVSKSDSTDLAAPESNEVAVYENNAPRAFSTEVLSSITSFDDVSQLFADNEIPLESADQYGSGFDILDNKGLLVDVPFVILEWRFNASDLAEGGFVSAAIVTERNDKWIINDGGTGIFEQLKRVTASRLRTRKGHPQLGLVCQNGLSVSNYETTVNINGKDTAIKGTTYYIKGM